ncbi:MAG: FtsX-like permease family protein, partial [Pseudolysinimonas sp.]
ATTRADETALIWSRGASALDIALTTGAEVATAAAVGLLIGGATGVGALVLATGGTDVLLTLGVAAWAVPLAGALSAALLAALSAYRTAGRQTVRDPADASGRVRRLTAPGLVALVVAAAGLTVWQLRLYGSPVTPSSDGGSGVDPIAVVAPALALIAVVLLVVLVFPLLAGLADRVSQRRSVTSQLAARTVARRVSLAVAPLVVVALATGSTVVAAAYSATWTQSFDITSALRAGADVHVTSRLDGIGANAVADVQSTPGVSLTAPIEVQPLSVGGESGSIVAASPDAVARLATTASGSFDPESAGEAIAVTVPAPELPADATRVDLGVHLEGYATAPAISLWVVDDLGVLAELPLEIEDGSDPTSDVITYGADLTPPAGSPSSSRRVLSVEVAIPDSAITGDSFGQFTMRTLDVTTTGTTQAEVSLDQYWIPDSAELQFSPPNGDGTGLGFVVYSDTLRVRLTPSFDTTFNDRVAPPVLISQQLADVFDVGVGDELTYAVQDGLDRITAKIVGVVPAIPGAPADIAVLMDLTVIQHYQLRVTQEPARARDVWISAADPQAVAQSIRPAFPANAQIVTALDPAGRQVLGSATLALWAGSAVCGVLALIGVAVAARAQLRSRRGEVAVLRAIGLGSGDQAAIRVRELATVLCAGLVAGLLAGAVVSLLTVPQLARAAIPDPYPAVGTAIAIDIAGLAIGLGALVVALAIIAAIAGAGVASLARRALPADGAL